MNLYNLEIPKQKIRQLNSKGIYNINDLLAFIPKEYFDYTTPLNIRSVMKMPEKTNLCFIGRLTDLLDTERYIRATYEDDTGKITVMYFGQPYMAKFLRKGQKYMVCGKTSINPYNDNIQMINPRYTTYDLYKYRRIIPRYVKIKGMSEEYLLNTMEKGLKFGRFLPDYDKKLITEYNIMTKAEAVKQIHNPETFQTLEKAKERLIFDTIFNFLWISKEKDAEDIIETSVKVEIDNMDKHLAALPFTLTDDQLRVVSEIKEEMKRQKRANALVQGDVGSGKTIVAFLLMFFLADNGYQSVMCAPTQTLASQHYEDLMNYEKIFGYKVAYLTGDTKKRERNKILKQLANKEIDILVSTHAAFSDEVKFANLGLKIIDEEHRFGVLQRDAINKKYPDIHSISMSATPIPRSLALISYGDKISVHNILQKPNGRKEVITIATDSNKTAYDSIIEEVEKGHQAYIVCPLIDEGKIKANNVTAIEKNFDDYVRGKRKNIKIASISGKMKQSDINETVEKFKNNEIDVLISTTIVEVGVNVPNATVMAIMSSERFGLSQLHQLRGRVGRGNDQSYCILVAKDSDIERLKVMESTTNGFEIAKEDLKLRGPGDVLGTKQAGESEELELVISLPKLTEQIRNSIEEIYKNEYRLQYYQNMFKNLLY